MKTIKQLPLLSRPVEPTDSLLVETGNGTTQIAATAFKGDKGDTGATGAQGEHGIQGEQGAQGAQGIPGTAQGVRETASTTTGTLAQDETETGVWTIAKSFEALQLTVTSSARVRLYSTIADRDADISRKIGAALAAGNGLILEVNASTVLDQALNPHAHGSNMENTQTNDIAYTITNKGAVAAITTTITFLRKEQ